MAVRLEKISKRLGWTWALREIGLEVERGSSVVLIGPNGAGKTTLLRLVAMLRRYAPRNDRKNVVQEVFVQALNSI